jgi:hypothetical protein
MAKKFEYYCFDVDVNPYGILYNPFSMANVLEFLIQERQMQAEDLVHVNGKWVSLYHHGSFSDPDRHTCIEKINSRVERGAKVLREADLLVMTWGSAWVYKHLKKKIVVTNCHKIPDNEFARYRLRVEEIVERYAAMIPALRQINPGMRILFTVSPIRHWRDGAHENQLSKAVLLLTIEQLQNRFENIYYFPSYEILLDELRDYRFYAEDMLHPSEMAVNYIWEIFKSTYIAPGDFPLMRQVEALRKRMNHRPLDLDTGSYQQLKQQLDTLIETIRKDR